MTFGRDPITIVEIDIDYCSLSYGVGACTAALSASKPRKCFNTYRTCQDQVNFAKSTLTLRFAENRSELPKTGTFFPALRSVSTRAGWLNLSGLDPRSGPLGKRDRVEIRLGDFTYHDGLVDKYRDERKSGAAQFDGVGYDPTRGTFFQKLIARSPYYLGRPLRVLKGYAGQALSAMATSHYVISEWTGPSAAGEVTIVAKDILNLVEGPRAQAPAPSSGKLADAMDTVAATATLTPAGIGNAEYPASGRISIGREIVTFTRLGDQLTLTGRGIDGTTASDHDAGDVAQLCLRYENARISDIYNDLLTVQGPVDAAFVPLAAWNADDDGWMSGQRFTATIPKPEPISVLIGELGLHGAHIWWDPDSQQVEFRPNRPRAPGEAITALNDVAHFLENSVEVARLEEQRISAILFYHGLLDPTESVTRAANYAKSILVGDPSSASDLEHGEARLQRIFSRWFGRLGDDAAASVIAERLVSRFRDTPQALTFDLAPKDDGVGLADFVDASSWLLPDETGQVPTLRMQIAMRERRGDRIGFRAESGVPEARFGYWMTEPQADYDTATEDEKIDGAFWFDENETDFGDGTGPYEWF